MEIERGAVEILKEALYTSLIERLTGAATLVIIEAPFRSDPNEAIRGYVEDLGYSPKFTIACTNYLSDSTVKVVGATETQEEETESTRRGLSEASSPGPDEPIEEVTKETPLVEDTQVAGQGEIVEVLKAIVDKKRTDEEAHNEADTETLYEATAAEDAEVADITSVEAMPTSSTEGQGSAEDTGRPVFETAPDPIPVEPDKGLAEPQVEVVVQRNF